MCIDTKQLTCYEILACKEVYISYACMVSKKTRHDSFIAYETAKLHSYFCTAPGVSIKHNSRKRVGFWTLGVDDVFEKKPNKPTLITLLRVHFGG